MKQHFFIFKNIFGLTILFVFNQSAWSQTTGYMGKKCLVKTNIVNGRNLPFTNIDLEFVAKRLITFNTTFQLFNYGVSESGKRVNTGKIKPGNNRDEVKEISILKNGQTQGWMLGVGCRYYFNNIIPAPLGLYTGFSVGFGKASFSNYDVSYEFEGSAGPSFSSNFETHPKLPVTGLGGQSNMFWADLPCIGYQKLFKRIVTLDAHFAMQSQYLSLPDEVLNAFDYNYFTRTNTITKAFGKFSIGPAIYVKLGLLIF